MIKLTAPSYLPDKQKTYLDKLIKKSTDDQQALFAVQAIIKIIETVEQHKAGKGQDVLQGAHIVMQDKKVYQQLMKNTSNRKRVSSHYRGEKQEEKGIDLKAVADFLVGLNEDEKVWMQLEGHKVSFKDGWIRGSILVVLHILDYLKYKFTGKNVGPCGLSEHIDSNPIFIKNDDIFPGLGDGILDEFFAVDDISQLYKKDGEKSFSAKEDAKKEDRNLKQLSIS